MKSPKISIFLTLLITIFTLAACTNENQAKIIGDWQGFSWVIDGQESARNAATVEFTFAQDGNYTGSWGNANAMEKGVFDMDGDKLYTTEEGKIKKMVKIEFLGNDTLVFHMNRTGTEEHLFLVRE